MTNYFKFLQHCCSIMHSKIKTLIGSVCCALFAVFVIFSIPVYIFRVIVTKLAKWIRPDLGDILNGQSGIFVNDYFETTAPRANIVCILHCQGVVTYEDIKNRLINELINVSDQSTGELLYEKLQQYPVKWLGFAFWKKAYNTFSIDNHVYKHSGMDSSFSEDEKTSLVEELLNTRFSKKKSPWEFHVIENYQHEESKLLKKPSEKNKDEKHSIIVFRFHHCLSDGTGVLKVLLEGVLQNYTVDEMKMPRTQDIKRSMLKRVSYWMCFPAILIIELSHLFSPNFKTYPWSVPDKNKKWRQVYASSELIPIDLIKDIKNTFGVSFTSVLLSIISGAVEKIEGTKNVCSRRSEPSTSWPCTSMLPAFGSKNNRQTLENHFTAVIFDLPIANFPSQLDRLKAIHEALKNARNSVIPFIIQVLSTIMGAHFLCVGGPLAKNRQIPIALTNFAATPENDLVLHKHAKIVHIDAAVGGMSGDMGVVLATVSHNGHLRINITAEEAIMTSSNVKQFAEHINEEVVMLRNLMLMKNQ